MYYFNPEKPLRLAKFYGIGGIFNLAIQVLFTKPSILDSINKSACLIFFAQTAEPFALTLGVLSGSFV